jgi:hypothetical protein
VGNIEKDHIYIVCTVRKRVNSYRLLTRPPKTLEINEICFHLTVPFDRSQWFNRTIDISYDQPIKPPIFQKPNSEEVIQPQHPANQVLDRMTGR